MKPQLFDTKRKLKWIPYSYLFVIFVTVSPLLFAWLAGIIGDSMGCNINEGGTDECVRIGIHFGWILNQMVAGVWSLLLSVPIGLIIVVILTIVAVNDWNYFRK
jgi:hypothetical protein